MMDYPPISSSKRRFIYAYSMVPLKNCHGFLAERSTLMGIDRNMLDVRIG